ncbi:hypothetical protein PBCV1_A484L [Paramecium bursaria Chlorella virus 1]|uniref:Uncharacterized protein n=1 Tax=Paramecium bursaria Chlorella virus 1 TaxID=10506 RepID=Q98534_PBCV1|nr:hypothetical protein PBCV1_A484L [Paramecium bursaria Chlorella virus 1]AAC96851.1 hypothetical protein [Paramecium bursaria Chlorella virus 1]8H2I_ch Chain ch, P15 [Paramecium bursaria Chlorella virus 1]
MWLFFFALAVIYMIYKRDVFKKIAVNLKMNGVSIPFVDKYSKQYPTYTKNALFHVTRFNNAYQKTFEYKNISIDTINNLFSIRDDVLYNISEIKLRLPNDLTQEKEINYMYEKTDQRLMEYITDVKSRFHINIYPGTMSSAFEARNYRASNDIVF